MHTVRIINGHQHAKHTKNHACLASGIKAENSLHQYKKFGKLWFQLMIKLYISYKMV